MLLFIFIVVSWLGYYRVNRRFLGFSCDELNNVKGLF